tara:strand:+ start:941 stop:2191 length:1251 start_codon:yes stop_codon:yes gene_type:complete
MIDIIIGGGISGLSYALFNQNKSLIIERESELGGYCRSIKRNGFVWDFSGHFFHFRNKDVKKIMLSHIKGKVLDVQKKTSIYYNTKLIDFPFQANIHQLPADEFLKCLVDLFEEDSNKKKINSFKDFIINKYGQSICDKFLIPYNEKLYATDLNNLDWKAMGRFFPSVSKENIVRSFGRKKVSSYNDVFTYPKEGAEAYVQSIVSQVKNTSYKMNTAVTKINTKKKIVYLNSGEKINYNNLITSTPLPKLLELCNIKFNKKNFTANKVCVFNIGFDKKSTHNDHWIYFPSKKISFYRVGFYDNIFNSNKMSLYVEIGVPENKIIDSKMLYKKIIHDLKTVDIISNQKVVDFEYLEMNPAYVHITKKSEKQKKKFQKQLEKNNIYSIGRYGDWKYCSIEDNILQSKDLNRKLSNRLK